MIAFHEAWRAGLFQRSHWLRNLVAGVLVYAIQGPLLFGAVEKFERALAETRTDP